MSPIRKLLISGISVTAAALVYHSRCPPSNFTPSTLVDSEDVSFNTKLITLSVPPELYPRAFAPIWSIFIKDSDIQVERPYTPLEGVDENGHMKLWIKRYEHGEVGRWIHSKRVGETIEIRGPVQTWPASWQNGCWDEVVLISGGTGITPFYQLLHGIFKTRDVSCNARFTLLHGSRSLSDLPPASMLQSLEKISQEYPDKFQLHLFVESTNDTPEPYPVSVRFGWIGKSAVQDALRMTHTTSWWSRLFGLSTPTPIAPSNKVLVLVCGPEGMVNVIAGPYGRNYSQGEVGGILREIGLQPHQVWKL